MWEVLLLGGGLFVQGLIRSIKEKFNIAFDEVLKLKEIEIARILEKNSRILKISRDLKVEQTVVKPSLDSDEQPERLLLVEDKEVTVERYISPKEQKLLEEQRKLDEERRLREKVHFVMMQWQVGVDFTSVFEVCGCRGNRLTIGGSGPWT